MFPRSLSRFIASSPDGLLWFPDPAGGAAAGDGGGTPPPAGATPPPGAAAAPPAGATPPPGSTTPPPSSQFTYPEDRSNWVPLDKHKKSEQLINRTAAELNTLRVQIADRDRRIAALAGVTVPSAEETEAEKVAAAFYSLPQFAHLKDITPEFVTAAKRMLEQGASLAEARDHVYNQQADRFLSTLDTAFKEELGADTLTPGQTRKLRAAFGASMPDAREDPEGFAAFKQRYDSGDESLITEFVKEYAAEILEPARRQATVPITQRRPVPRGGPSSAVVTQKQKPDYAKMSIQEMLEAGEKEAEALGR